VTGKMNWERVQQEHHMAQADNFVTEDYPPGPYLVYISGEDDPVVCYVCGEEIKWLDYAAAFETSEDESYRHVEGPCRAAQLRHEALQRAGQREP
jgi:hypothetical protein